MKAHKKGENRVEIASRQIIWLEGNISFKTSGLRRSDHSLLLLQLQLQSLILTMSPQSWHSSYSNNTLLVTKQCTRTAFTIKSNGSFQAWSVQCERLNNDKTERSRPTWGYRTYYTIYTHQWQCVCVYTCMNRLPIETSSCYMSYLNMPWWRQNVMSRQHTGHCSSSAQLPGKTGYTHTGINTYASARTHSYTHAHKQSTQFVVQQDARWA